MPRAKKAPSAPSTSSTEAPGKPVVSVNPDPVNGGIKTNNPVQATSNLQASSPSKASGSVKANGDLEAAIRARAYQIYEERGRTDGRAQEDWVRAERELQQQHGKRTA
jgi:hypothetical protein